MLEVSHRLKLLHILVLLSLFSLLEKGIANASCGFDLYPSEVSQYTVQEENVVELCLDLYTEEAIFLEKIDFLIGYDADFITFIGAESSSFDFVSMIEYDNAREGLATTLLYNNISGEALEANQPITTVCLRFGVHEDVDFEFLLSEVTLNDINYCSDSLLIDQNTLTLQLVEFATILDDNSVLLLWQTSFEEGLSHFIVQHSSNGSDFEAIAELSAVGSTQNVSQYTFEHTTPSIGVNYYRLLQVYADGKRFFSPIRTIQTEGTPKFTAFSLIDTRYNVQSKEIKVTIYAYKDADVTLYLIDPMGRYISNGTYRPIRKNRIITIYLEGSELPEGIIFVKAVHLAQVESKPVMVINE